MMNSKVNPKQIMRTDDDILADIWDALWKEDAHRSLDMGSLSIYVKDGEVYVDGYLIPENDLSLVVSVIHPVAGVVAVHNLLRTDEGILADIWDALRKEEAVRSLDLSSLLIDVMGGEVYLEGHLALENNLPLIDRIAHSIAGVVAVHNHLVADRDLTIQVARALARDEHTRPYILTVNANHGWIYLGGEVPTRDLQHVAEKVAGELPAVRGVIALPRVTGESPTPPKRAVQPRIGAAVYSRNREEGVVTQVVIQPQDRLVTHVVVRSNEIRDTNLVARETVVPVEDINRVNDESAYIGRNGAPLGEYPLFDPDEFPLALFTWKAPYPYTAGEVRWSLRQLTEVPDTPPATSLEPASSERKADGTRIDPAPVSV